MRQVLLGDDYGAYENFEMDNKGLSKDTKEKFAKQVRNTGMDINARK